MFSISACVVFFFFRSIMCLIVLFPSERMLYYKSFFLLFQSQYTQVIVHPQPGSQPSTPVDNPPVPLGSTSSKHSFFFFLTFAIYLLQFLFLCGIKFLCVFCLCIVCLGLKKQTLEKLKYLIDCAT